ncbi:MAG: glycoside hydrolase family 3 C-terminal domain-containing protein, partial [Janthinobacterium lividum]
SIVAAVNAGLDMGQFVGKPPAKANERASALITASDDSFDGEDIRVAVRAGRISPARIEDLIMRRLVPEFRVGTFDHVTQRPAGDASTAAHRQIAADIVAAGAVLLKNKGAVLPLGPGVRSIAVIGTQAGVAAVVTEMGSAYVTSTHTIAAFPAIRQRAPAGTRVDYAPGTLGLERLPLAPASLFHTPSGSGGWQADYVANPNLDFSAKPFLSRVEDVVNNDTMPTDTRFPANRLWSVRWRATFVPTETGVQKFTLAGSGTARLTIGGKLIGRYANVDFGDTIYANLPMEAGKPIAVEIAWTPRVTFRESASDAYGTTLGPVVRFGWARPDGLIADAVEAARKADVAVVFAGHKVGEGMDRLTLGLPNDQEALIEAVAAANPRTLVMLQTGGAVSMPWLGKVAGVIEMWLPGDSIGPAAAQLLFGDVDPGGRLPVTFPADEEQGPASEASQYPGSLDPATGALDAVHFDEGLFVGYRYWDARDQKPLFPFGYGLSYTSFDIVGRDVLKTADGGVIVDVVVRNTGGRPGSEVVQVYVGFPASAGEPPRQLKGFQKVSLKPGEARAVRIRLDSRAFQYWSDGERRWVTDAGSYQVMVGRSSREILYSNKVQLAER